MIALLKPYLIAAGLAAAALGVGYAWGRMDENAAGKIERLKEMIAAEKKWDEIDEGVKRTDRYGVCLDLGGLPDKCDKLRRMEKAAKPE